MPTEARGIVLPQMDEYKQVLLRTRSTVSEEWLAPPDLRPRLVALAADRGSNMTDVVIELLSEHYGIEYDLTGRRSVPGPDPGVITLRIPVSLHRAAAQRAGSAYPQISIPQEVTRVLCERLGIALIASA
jgi:hypothetical protein